MAVNMAQLKTFVFVLNLASAAFGFISSYYWYKSAMTNPPEIDTSTGMPKGPVSMRELNKTAVQGAAATRVAAGWTSAATLMFALASVVGALT